MEFAPNFWLPDLTLLFNFFLQIADWNYENVGQQVAQENHLQWLRRDNKRQHPGSSKSSTVTSADFQDQDQLNSGSICTSASETIPKKAKFRFKKSTSSTGIGIINWTFSQSEISMTH